MEKAIVLGVLLTLLWIFCLGFKWVAIRAIRNFKEQEENDE